MAATAMMIRAEMLAKRATVEEYMRGTSVPTGLAIDSHPKLGKHLKAAALHLKKA